MNMKLSYLASCALIGTMLVSCTNNLNEPTNGPTQTGTLKIIKDPQVIAWSGNQTFSTRSTGYASDITANSYAPKTRTIPEGYDNGNEIIAWKDLNDNIVKTVDGDNDQKIVINEQEQTYIDDRLPEERGNLQNVDFNFLFFAASPDEDLVFKIYPVFGQSSSPHDIGMFYYDDQGTIQIIEEYVWSKLRFGDWGQKYWQTSATGREIRVKAGYKFGFYWENDVHYYPTDDPNNQGNTAQKTRAYSSSTLNQESYISVNWVAQLDQKTKIRAALFDNSDDENNPTKRTYFGIEDSTDFDYQDVVFATDKILVTVEPDEVMPNIPGDGDSKCERCGHNHHGTHDEIGTCEECKNAEEGDCYVPDESVCDHCGHPGHDHQIENCEECAENGAADGAEGPCKKEETGGGETGGGETTETPTQPSTPSTPSGSKIKHNNEVEINLELQDSHSKYDVEDLVSKLSIHVRYGGDVEVFLPIPYGYFCDVDDLDIREADLFVKDGILAHTVSYDFGGHTVSLTVTYETENEQCGIRITTSGITQEVLDYCYETYGDGINFEVYNYYALYEKVGDTYVRVEGEAGNVERDVILGYLNDATVKFLGSANDPTLKPNYYINAFGWDYVDDSNGKQIQNPDEPNPDDCTVSIIGDQRGGYSDEPTITEHLNGTPFNYIYTNKDVKADDAHVAHNHN